MDPLRGVPLQADVILSGPWLFLSRGFVIKSASGNLSLAGYLDM